MRVIRIRRGFCWQTCAPIELARVLTVPQVAWYEQGGIYLLMGYASAYLAASWKLGSLRNKQFIRAGNSGWAALAA